MIRTADYKVDSRRLTYSGRGSRITIIIAWSVGFSYYIDHKNHTSTTTKEPLFSGFCVDRWSHETTNKSKSLNVTEKSVCSIYIYILTRVRRATRAIVFSRNYLRVSLMLWNVRFECNQFLHLKMYKPIIIITQ